MGAGAEDPLALAQQFREEEVDRAVGLGPLGERGDPLLQRLAHPHHFPEGQFPFQGARIEDAQMIQVERECELLLGDDDRRPGAQGVTHPELVDGVRVGGGEVGDDEIRLQQLLVHRLVDQRRMNDLIGTDAREAGGHDRRLNDVLVGAIEVEDALGVGLEVCLLAKTHDDEALL